MFQKASTNTFFPDSHCLKCVRTRRFSSLHFLVFGLNMEKYPVSFCICSKFQQIWTRKTKNTDAVNGVATTAMVQQVSLWLTSVSKSDLRKSKKNQAIQEIPKTFKKILATFLFLLPYSQLAIHIYKTSYSELAIIFTSFSPSSKHRSPVGKFKKDGNSSYVSVFSCLVFVTH